jgi:hypothetical protein
MNTWKKKLKDEWDRNPVGVVVVGTLALTAIAKTIDALSAAQGRRAYARQIDYKIHNPYQPK